MWVLFNNNKSGMGTPFRERIKCLIFDSELCTFQKVGGEDRSESVLNAIQIHLQGWGWGISKK